MKKKFILSSVTLVFLFLAQIEAQYTVLYNFNTTDGKEPDGIVALSASGKSLYGMTVEGGSMSDGRMFSLDTNGGNYSNLLDFNGSNGAFPQTSLILFDNRLYGACKGGGLGYGCVYSIDTDGTGFKDLHDFNASFNYPNCLLTFSNGVLYGALTQANFGCIYKVDTDGTGYKEILVFNRSYGATPDGNLIVIGNVVYGQTYNGGANNDGCIYAIDTSGQGYRDLYDFVGAQGIEPDNGLTLYGNKFYGTTDAGGAHGDGVVFSIDSNGSGYKDILDFSGANGNDATCSLTPLGKTLYGISYLGGANNEGCIFSLDTDGSAYRDLHDFAVATGEFPSQGQLAISGNALYGTTYSGGINTVGVVFRFIDSTILTSQRWLPESNADLIVFPNPSSGIFNFQLSAVSGQWSVEVFNVLGEKVFSKSYQSLANGYQLDLRGQPNGVYFYRVLGEDGTMVGNGKLIIDK